jgi:ubiquitin carboxyl-terminal hydrolase 8
LVGRAQEAIELAREYADTEELDKAYVQYLRASEITINIIPHHPDYRITVNQSPAWYKQFASLMMVRFSAIRGRFIFFE